MSISVRPRSRLRAAGRWLAAALLPQDCFLCGAPSGDELLCVACGNDLPAAPRPACRVCALPTPEGELCGTCLKQAPHFDATYATFRYEFPVDRLVQSLKYQHRLAIAAYFARRMLAGTLPGGPGLLLAMPLAEPRLRERGFNQALEIARPLARALDWPLVISGYARSIDTLPQTSLPWQARHKNMQGAFDCAISLEGRRVVVVDDVMTTGATVNEFARTLKKHGAASVTNWVVARALRH